MDSEARRRAARDEARDEAREAAVERLVYALFLSLDYAKRSMYPDIYEQLSKLYGVARARVDHLKGKREARTT